MFVRPDDLPKTGLAVLCDPHGHPLSDVMCILLSQLSKLAAPRLGAKAFVDIRTPAVKGGRWVCGTTPEMGCEILGPPWVGVT
jgi:hypothetical protein